MPSRTKLLPGQYLSCCLPWGLAKLVWPMAMPKEDGDGVGPKGEGALRAPLGEPEAWMFPAHIRTTHTHQRAHQTKDDKYSLHTLTPCAHKLKLGGRAVDSGWRAEMEGNGRSMTKRMLCSLLAARCACCKRNN